MENATFALAFKRYGLDDHLDRLAGAMLEAAAASSNQRLPELLTGHRREPSVATRQRSTTRFVWVVVSLLPGGEQRA